MAITGITPQSLIASLGYLDTTDSTGTTSSTDSSSPLSALVGSSSQSSDSSSQTSLTSFSQLGKLLSSLSALQQKSPDDFKKMASTIAGDFHDAASQTSDIMQRLSLDSMASQFSNAGLTGSMSALSTSAVTGSIAGYNAYQNSMSLLDTMTGSDTSSSITDILSQNMSSLLS